MAPGALHSPVAPGLAVTGSAAQPGGSALPRWGGDEDANGPGPPRRSAPPASASTGWPAREGEEDEEEEEEELDGRTRRPRPRLCPSLGPGQRRGAPGREQPAAGAAGDVFPR